MAVKPLQHDEVRLLRCLFEDGMAATRQHDEFGSAQFAIQLCSGSQTDRTVTIAPHQKHWNPLDAAEYGLKLGHLGEPAANNAEDVSQCPRAPQAINDFLQTAIDNAIGTSVHFCERDALNW